MSKLRVVWLAVSAALIVAAIWVGGAAPFPSCC